MMNPTVNVADATPRAAPRRMASCFPDSLLEGAGGAGAASEVLKMSIWHSDLEYSVRVMPGERPVATAEAKGSKFSSTGGGETSLGVRKPRLTAWLHLFCCRTKELTTVPYNRKCLCDSKMHALPLLQQDRRRLYGKAFQTELYR